jgi:hypothetical protein
VDLKNFQETLCDLEDHPQPWPPGMSKRMSYGKIYRPDIRARLRLPRGHVFTYGRVFTARELVLY